MNSPEMNPRLWPIVESVDPSGKRGLFITWATVSPNERWYVVHAKRIPHGAFSEMAHAIKVERQYLAHEPNFFIMDKRGGAHTIDMESQDTWFDRFRHLGLAYNKSTGEGRSLNNSIASLAEWLRPVLDEETGQAVPKLRICKGVRERNKENPFWALESFLWDPEKTLPWHYKQKTKDYVDTLLQIATYPNLTYRRLATTGQYSAGSAPSLAASYRKPRTMQSRTRTMTGLSLGRAGWNGQRSFR